MRNENTFGLHFILRVGRTVRGKSPIYARISVNKTKCELALKCHIRKEDWNSVRGTAKTGNEELKLLNSLATRYTNLLSGKNGNSCSIPVMKRGGRIMGSIT
jgi:hypothetical protein